MESGQSHPPKAPKPSLKVLIAGAFGVGKTSLVTAVSEVRPLTSEAPLTVVSEGVDALSIGSQKTTTTVAFDWGRMTIPADGETHGPVQLYLFGTPGQRRFGFFWDELSYGAVGAVVLVDTRKLNEDCYAALDFFDLKKLPFVVAINLFPEAPQYHSDQLRDILALRPTTPLVSCDARDRNSSLRTLIALFRLVCGEPEPAEATRSHQLDHPHRPPTS